MKLLRLILCALLVPISASAQVLQVAELNTEQIKALDRAKTAVIIPGGISHGRRQTTKPSLR